MNVDFGQLGIIKITLLKNRKRMTPTSQRSEYYRLSKRRMSEVDYKIIIKGKESMVKHNMQSI